MIYLLRHGLDDESKIGGWSDVGLTKEGIKQIKEAKNFITENISFRDIVSSDIKRASESAKIINEDFNKKIIYTSLLREQNKGGYNGLPKMVLKDDTFLKDLTIYDTFPNGESLLDLYFRIERLMLVIDTWDDNLLVTHRGVINMIYYLLNNKKPDMYKDSFDVTHASVHKLDLKSKTIERIY